MVSITEAGTWVQTSSLPDGYNSHCLAYQGGFLYQTGGSSNTRGPADGTNVFFAKLTNGIAGAWKSTTVLPAATLGHAGVAANGFIYVLGGEQYSAANGEVVTNAVYYAGTNSDGSLGAWQTGTPLPYNAYLLSASLWNNTIYVAGGTDDQSFFDSVYSASIQSNGALSAWTAQAPLPAAVVGQAQAANGVLYVLGGTIDGDSIVTSTVYYSKINADGSLAGWHQTGALPQAGTGLAAIASGGIVYSLGGWNGTPATNFDLAAVLGGGSLGAWNSGQALPIAIYDFGAACSGSYIYISGGLGNAVASSAVYSMALPPAPRAPTLVPLGVSPNAGLDFSLTSSTNIGFGILASTDLITWSNIGSGFTGTNGTLLFSDTNIPAFPARFYRAYWPLP